jgi:hypothetical protein
MDKKKPKQWSTKYYTENYDQAPWTPQKPGLSSDALEG